MTHLLAMTFTWVPCMLAKLVGQARSQLAESTAQSKDPPVPSYDSYLTIKSHLMHWKN